MMKDEVIFTDRKWCRVTIDEPYITKLTKKLKIKSMIGGLDEIDEFAVSILFSVLNGKNVWMDKEGKLR